MFVVILVVTLVDGFRVGSTTGAFESASSWHGIGGIFLIPVGTMCAGVVLALVLAVRKPGFFRRRAEIWPGEGVPLPYEDERVTE